MSFTFGIGKIYIKEFLKISLYYITQLQFSMFENFK